MKKYEGVKVYIDNPSHMKECLNKSRVELAFQLFGKFNKTLDFETVNRKMHDDVLSKIKFKEFTVKVAEDMFKNYVLDKGINLNLQLIEPCG